MIPQQQPMPQQDAPVGRPGAGMQSAPSGPPMGMEQSAPPSAPPQGASPPGMQPQGGMEQQGAGVLFPHGFDVQRLTSDQPLTPQEQQQVQDAANLGRGMAEDPSVHNALGNLLSDYGQGASVTMQVAGFCAGLVQKVMVQVAQEDGMSSLQWFALLVSTVSAVVNRLTEMGSQMSKEQAQQLLMATAVLLGKKMVEHGWVSKQQMQQLVQVFSQRQGGRQAAGQQQPDPGMGQQTPQPTPRPEGAGAPPPNQTPPEAGQEMQADSSQPKKPRKRKRGSRGGKGGKDMVIG